MLKDSPFYREIQRNFTNKQIDKALSCRSLQLKIMQFIHNKYDPVGKAYYTLSLKDALKKLGLNKDERYLDEDYIDDTKHQYILGDDIYVVYANDKLIYSYNAQEFVESLSHVLDI